MKLNAKTLEQMLIAVRTIREIVEANQPESQIVFDYLYRGEIEHPQSRDIAMLFAGAKPGIDYDSLIDDLTKALQTSQE